LLIGRAGIDVGIELWGVDAILVTGNHVENCWAGIFRNYSTTKNFTISQNMFKNCQYGILLGPWNSDFTGAENINLSILYNKIESDLDNSLGIWLQTKSNTNLTVIGNSIALNLNGATNTLGISIYGATDGQICNNSIRGYPFRTIQLFNSVNCRFYNNTGPDGLLCAGINTPVQIEQANGLVRKSITSASYQAAYGDYYLGVKTVPSTTYSITLPSAGGSKGNQVIIVDEGGCASSSPISISSSVSTETINGATSKNIVANYGSLTFVSNGTNWFAY
jgi:hypothetical protein